MGTQRGVLLANLTDGQLAFFGHALGYQSKRLNLFSRKAGERSLRRVLLAAVAALKAEVRRRERDVQEPVFFAPPALAFDDSLAVAVCVDIIGKLAKADDGVAAMFGAENVVALTEFLRAVTAQLCAPHGIALEAVEKIATESWPTARSAKVAGLAKAKAEQ